MCCSYAKNVALIKKVSKEEPSRNLKQKGLTKYFNGKKLRQIRKGDKLQLK